MDEIDALRIHIRLDAEQVYAPSGERVGISTADLLAISHLSHQVSIGVATRCAFELMESLGASREDVIGAVRRTPDPEFSPGQISDLRSGSIELFVVLTTSGVVSWTFKNLLGEAVVAGWKESAVRERVKAAARNLFGGAAAEVEKSALTAQLPGNLQIEDVAVEAASPSGTTTDMRLLVRKVRSPELEALAEIDLFAHDSEFASTDLDAHGIEAAELGSEDFQADDHEPPPPMKA